MDRAIRIVNALNYLFLILGIVICLIFTKSVGDLLIYFGATSLAAGVFSGRHISAADTKLRKVGLTWFIVNMVNLFVLIPLIIFLLFFGLGYFSGSR